MLEHQWRYTAGDMGKRLIRIGLKIQKWWRDVQADPDRRTNLFFLYASILVATITIAAFLWLIGILEWRGSNEPYVTDARPLL